MSKFINVTFENSSDNNLRTLGSKEYVFKCDQEVAKGDLVVCETSRGYGIGTVVGEETHETRRKMATAWIISKVDLTAHKIRLEKEQKMSVLKAKMTERKKALEDEAVFALLADKDPEMAAMLAEFNALKV
jgi:predicted Mrr-cat superfamily restriction endonuclease